MLQVLWANGMQCVWERNDNLTRHMKTHAGIKAMNVVARRENLLKVKQTYRNSDLALCAPQAWYEHSPPASCMPIIPIEKELRRY